MSRNTTLRIHLLLDREARIFWRKMQKDLRNSLNNQYLKAAKQVEHGIGVVGVEQAVNTYKAEMEKIYFNTMERIASRYEKYYENIVGDKIAIKANVDTYWNAVRNYMRLRTAEQVAKVAKTTKKLLKSVIEKGLAEELTMTEIAANIVTVGKIANKARAMNIARTETHSIQNYSIDESVKSTGIKFTRVWSAALDERTRVEHADADGQPREQNEAFIVGGESLMYPGDPTGSPENICRCRCAIMYEDK